MKNVLLLILTACVLAAGYWLYVVINAPIEFNTSAEIRKTAVVEKIKDIRIAQRAYKRVKGQFAPSFDSLVNFINNDSIQYEIKMGSADDSVAVAEGRVKTIIKMIAAKDTVFGSRDVKIEELSLIPYGNGAEFKMSATIIETGNQGVKVPVFCATAEYKTYLGDLPNGQELVNLYDFDKTVGNFPGIKVGSLERATNDAGNWED